MKKSLTILFLLTFLLTSCNFPLAQATPDMALVATRVPRRLLLQRRKPRQLFQ
jgi:hypothetical protein